MLQSVNLVFAPGVVVIINYPLFADADTGIYLRADTIFITFLNVSAALKSPLSH